MNFYYDIYKTSPSTIQILREFVLNDEYGIRVVGDENQSISKTSWPDEARNEENDSRFIKLFQETYWNGYVTWLTELMPHLKELSFQNLWYQVYEEGDSHDWHVHSNAHLGNVLYLNLPDKSLCTHFMIDNEHVVPDVEEGDTIVFNPFLTHCSPVNTSKEKKIVIAFNVSWTI